MKTIDNLRDEFRAYFAHLRDAQRADGAPVPNRREEWSRFVAHYIDEGFIPAEAANWTALTKKINGGTIGLDDRVAHTSLALNVFDSSSTLA